MSVNKFYNVCKKYFNFLFKSAKNKILKKILKNYKYAKIINKAWGRIGEVRLPTTKYKFLVVK